MLIRATGVNQPGHPIWSDLLKIKDIYLQGRKIITRDGKKTLFWKDTWLHDKPLCLIFPDLFKICEQPDVTVHHMKLEPQMITFTR